MIYSTDKLASDSEEALRRRQLDWGPSVLRHRPTATEIGENSREPFKGVAVRTKFALAYATE